jgi:acyl-CoA reductase-like NAD-dependent aldehyde dehydrogenase
MIVTPSADLDLAVRSIVSRPSAHAASGASLRRLIVHESIAEDLLARLPRYTRVCRLAIR